MKIVIVSKTDIEGGAGRAAYRLHRALLGLGHDSKMLVISKKSSDSTVIRAPKQIIIKNKIYNFFERLILKLFRINAPGPLSFNFFNSGLAKYINSLNPDVINLHWIHDSMMSISEVVKLEAPVAWTLHDMWVGLGLEHYGRLISEEGKSSFYFEYSANNFLDKIVRSYKKNKLSKKKILFITPSKWLMDQINQSLELKNKNIEAINNCVPLNVYKPFSKKECREILDLPQDKKIILYGAVNPYGDSRKGYKYLIEVIGKISKTHKKDKIICVTFGGNPGISVVHGVTTISVGSLSDDQSLSLYYNAADVFIMSSEQENLANTLVEAASCGIPSVCFDVGGNSEVVSNGVNGFTVEAFNTELMTDKILETLYDKEFIKENIYSSSLKQFHPDKIGKQYLDLFNSILK